MKSTARNLTKTRSETDRNSNKVTGSYASKFKSTALGLVNRFARDESGTFATIFAVSAMAVFLTIGAAVDYSQLTRAKSVVNNSLDAAILAAGNDLLENDPSDEELRKTFEDHLFANLGGHPNLLNTVEIDTFSVDQDTGQISASLNTPVEMAFMGIVGIQEMPVTSASEAIFSSTPVEISMVLDVTGSMNSDGKLDSLKLAATKAIDILLPDGSSNSNVRVGLVPYSEGVRLSKKLSKKASGQNTYTCMTERSYNPYTDVSYTSEYVGADDEAECSGNKIRPLTNNGTKLKNKIDGLSASGYTAGHLGIAWGYYMLSENWQPLWAKAAKPDDYGTSTKKIAILMTDGEFNTYFQGVSGDPTGPQQAKSENDAKALCTDMKKSKSGGPGITVYSIAFNAPLSAKQTLQHCATPDTATTTFYYNANNQAELESAFVEIAQSIKSLRLSR